MRRLDLQPPIREPAGPRRWTGPETIHPSAKCLPFPKTLGILISAVNARVAGKTRFLEVLEMLAARPWLIVEPSEAVPTLY